MCKATSTKPENMPMWQRDANTTHNDRDYCRFVLTPIFFQRLKMSGPNWKELQQPKSKQFFSSISFWPCFNEEPFLAWQFLTKTTFWSCNFFQM